MKNIYGINENALIYEIMEKVIQEKNDLIWILPFSQELNSKVCAEVLKTKYFICNN